MQPRAGVSALHLQEVALFATQRAQAQDIQYLNCLPLMNTVAGMSGKIFTATLNSPFVASAKRGGAAGSLAEAGFDAAVSFYVSTGTHIADRNTGQRIIPLDVELARCCPSATSFQNMVTTIANGGGDQATIDTIIASVLDVTHELDCFWKQGALIHLLEFLRDNRHLDNECIKGGAEGMLANFTRSARTPEDGQLLFRDLMRCTKGEQMPELSTPALTLALMNNTRPFFKTKIQDILELVSLVFNRGLDHATELEQAKATLAFLEVRLVNEDVSSVFQITNRLASIAFLEGTAADATETYIGHKEIEELVGVLRTTNLDDLLLPISERLRRFTRSKFVTLCEQDERVRVHKLACDCLDDCIDAALGPMLMKTVATAGLSFLGNSNNVEALKSMVGNKDLLECCVEYSKSFKKYQDKLTEEGGAVSKADIDAELEALQAEMDAGLINQREFTSKKANFTAMLDNTTSSPAVDQNNKLCALLHNLMELMPVRGLTVKLAADVIKKQEQCDVLFAEYGLALPAGLWETLKEHSGEADNLKYLLDVYANQVHDPIRVKS